MEHQPTIDTRHVARYGSQSSYTAGFLFSVALTLAAFALATLNALPTSVKLVVILAFAIAQLLVQLLFFLHIGREQKPRWNLIVLSFAGVLVLIVVVGSLWIMSNLQYNMMTPAQTDAYMMDQ